ncbi:death-associated inhibitor of apoptosis 2 [Anabrus simplex]|uniref:death-associated inhibitor of apoptosis 2 n=1 Tax=Anabrus simplex TaxID=316456 RepID=UPI0035A2D199
MNYEENRLQTFHSWPANAVVEPQRIAKAGFFYTGENLIVECFCCGGRISEWDYGDQVMAKHRILNPQCPFVKKPTEAGNVPVLNQSLSNVSYRSGTSQGSDSLQSNSPGSLTENSLEGSYPTSNLPSNNEFGSERLVQPHEPVENRNDIHSSRTAEVTCREFEADSLIRPSSNTDDIRLQEGIPDMHDEVDNRLRYRSEAARLETFRTWPKSHIVPPEQLAKSGFYYLQEEDKVKCAFCSGVVGHWEAGDDPDQEHRRHFPSCPLHYNVPVGNIPIDTHISGEQYGYTSNNVVMREFPPTSTPERDERRAVVEHSKILPERTDVLVEGIHQHRGPRHPKYSTVESRLRTFKDWPCGLQQTPNQLAQAGFYYTGVHDQVRCFHCDGGLRQWDDSDDPWVEHARWFPKCIYVLLMKSEEFIQEVATQYPPILPADDSHGKASKHITSNFPSYRVRNISEVELDNLMNTIPAQMAVGVGLDVSKIRRALRRKMEQTGLPYSTSDALIGAVLDMSSNSSSSHSPESPTPGPSQEYAGENDSNLQQNISERNDNREDDGASLQKEDQHKSSRNLAVSQSLPSLPHIACDEQRVYTVNQAGVVPLPDINKEKSENSSSAALLAEENRRLKEARLCKICMDEEVGVVFLPCGHLVTCVNCTPSLQDCPLCRQPIKATVRTFLS